MPPVFVRAVITILVNILMSIPNLSKINLGEGLFDLLTERANTPMKVNKAMEKEIATHYRKELKRVQSERVDDEIIDYEDF